MKKRSVPELPPIQDLRTELKREKYRRRYFSVFGSTVSTLLVVAAAAILVATLWLPVLQIYGGSMTPTLEDGEIIFTVKTAEPEAGDIIAFYYNNKILVKRVIGEAGDWINITEDGMVYVNEIRLDESYVVEPALGECDLTFPYQVPDGKWFVLGGSPGYVGGFPEQRGGLCGPGANRRENSVSCLAAEPAGHCELREETRVCGENCYRMRRASSCEIKTAAPGGGR